MGRGDFGVKACSPEAPHRTGERLPSTARRRRLRRPAPLRGSTPRHIRRSRWLSEAEWESTPIIGQTSGSMGSKAVAISVPGTASGVILIRRTHEASRHHRRFQALHGDSQATLVFVHHWMRSDGAISHRRQALERRGLRGGNWSWSHDFPLETPKKRPGRALQVPMRIMPAGGGPCRPGPNRRGRAGGWCRRSVPCHHILRGAGGDPPAPPWRWRLRFFAWFYRASFKSVHFECGKTVSIIHSLEKEAMLNETMSINIWTKDSVSPAPLTFNIDNYWKISSQNFEKVF